MSGNPIVYFADIPYSGSEHKLIQALSEQKAGGLNGYVYTRSKIEAGGTVVTFEKDGEEPKYMLIRGNESKVMPIVSRTFDFRSPTRSPFAQATAAEMRAVLGGGQVFAK